MKSLLAALLALSALLGLWASPALAQDWRASVPEIRIAVITTENETDLMHRWKPFADYLAKRLKVKVSQRQAADYAGVIEAMKARKLELALYGPASYAKAWMVMNGQVDPLAAPTDKDGFLGYKSMLIVRAASPYTSLADLKGTKLGLADPNSTSGNQAPRFFLKEQGVDVDKYFASATFSGSHENSVMGVMNGTFDCAAVPWYSENETLATRMERKGLIPPGSYRILWQSPLLPSSLFAAPAWLPQDMRRDLRQALLDLPQADPELFRSLFDGRAKSIVGVSHQDYEAVVRMIRENLEARRNS